MIASNRGLDLRKIELPAQCNRSSRSAQRAARIIFSRAAPLRTWPTAVPGLAGRSSVSPQSLTSPLCFGQPLNSGPGMLETNLRLRSSDVITKCWKPSALASFFARTRIEVSTFFATSHTTVVSTASCERISPNCFQLHTTWAPTVSVPGVISTTVVGPLSPEAHATPQLNDKEATKETMYFIDWEANA